MPYTGQIYVLESVVYRVELEPSVTLQNTDGLYLNFKFSQKVNFDIDSQYFSPPEVEAGSNGRKIDMNYGKTFLFICKPADLRQLLQIEPYVITLFDGTKTIGSKAVNWKSEFPEMVKFFETLGIVKSTCSEEWYDLQNGNGKKTARIKMFLRMSCFGTNVQTMFQVKKSEEDDKQQYIFRQRNVSKTFKVERFHDERNQPVIAPLYGLVTEPKSRQQSVINLRENASLTQLFDREITPKYSTYEGPTDDGDLGINLDFGQDYDIVSICFRPSENKFFDLLNVLTANVQAHGKGTCVTFQKSKVGRADSFMKSVGGGIKRDGTDGNIIIEDDDDMMLLSTADQIAKKLCGNLDCPAIKKFKEYGIGPLATGNNVGTLYGYVEPPLTYGLSHTYGTMSNYGPYGVYSRPKHEDLPFVPNEPISEPVKPCKMRRKDKSNKRSKKEKEKKPQWHSQGCPLCPDRLRGGWDDGMIESIKSDSPSNPAGEQELMPKSPMVECKSVMDQFDNILAEYKKAIGPCGQATCPYAQNLADDACKKACDKSMPQTNQSSSQSCNDVPCDIEGCPYAGETKTKRYPAGCGSPKCGYTKYKLGLVDEDAEMELQFLPPALAGNCGSPQCKYPLAPPLPPIHWDCPDPLPKGPCRNLNCPFQPPPLKKFKTKKLLKTGPCGSPMCAYALPQPCQVPTCPFAMMPCPMTQDQNQEPKKKKCSSSSEEEVCENPCCPFGKTTAEEEGPEEAGDLTFQGEFQDCVNPSCPFKKSKKEKKKKSKHKKKESACGNLECPFAKPSKDKDKKKKKQRKNKDSGDTSICSSPDCTFNQNNKRDAASSSDSVSLCSDPDCPYAELKMLKKKKKEEKGKGDAEEESLCSNPDCPERLKSQNNGNVCPVPGCPYSIPPNKSSPCVDPKCPLLQPLPSCGIPNCPYEPIPVRFSCKNSKCPSHKVDFSRKRSLSKLGISSDNADGNKKRLSQEQAASDNKTGALQTTTVCEDTVICDPIEDCDNPDCDMKPGENSEKKGKQNNNDISSPKKKGKKRKKAKFVYSIGDKYPGTKLGHKQCVMPVLNVPPHMGWLWNTFTPALRLKPRRGWRPGALTRTIASRIRAHRQAKGLGQVRIPNFKIDGTQYDEGADLKVLPKPTLQIQKKDGAYWITMNPLKDPFSLVENEDPYMDCTPMTFKITKNKKQEDEYCYCDGDEPVENMSSSSSDSELDIEFTPPAGIIHPERFKKKPNIVCCDTQYDPKDFEVEKKNKDKKGKGKDKKDKKGKKGKGGKGAKKGGKKK